MLFLRNNPLALPFVYFEIRVSPDGEGSRLPHSHAPRCHLALAQRNSQIMKIHMSIRYKISAAKSVFYRNSKEKHCVSSSSFVYVPYRAMLQWGHVYRSHATNAYQVAARDTFCPHGRTYFNVFRTVAIQFCPHGSVHYTVNDNS